MLVEHRRVEAALVTELKSRHAGRDGRVGAVLDRRQRVGVHGPLSLSGQMTLLSVASAPSCVAS